MHQKRYWPHYDPVALAVLVIGIGMIEVLALSIWGHRRSCVYQKLRLGRSGDAVHRGEHV